MFWCWMLLVGCGEIGIRYYSEICSDWDFDDEAGEDLQITMEGEELLVFRTGVQRGCSGSFQPEIEAYNRTIQVFEFWESADEGEDCSTCFTPTVVLSGLKERRDYELLWFEGRDSTLPIGAFEVNLSEGLRE
ncbi:MAG: hypothetical protein VX519_01060 [Myxococcota bacterium]|nr:hypothetical protein [Myxococcota bacterium]